MSKISVLVVEDNPVDLQLIKESLVKIDNYTFDCTEAESLESALRLIKHYDFDAVLIDLELPDSYGLDTVRKFMTSLPNTAIVVLSGLQNEEMALRTVRYGVQDCLDKRHLSPIVLSKSIRYSIERKKGLQDKEDMLQDLDSALQRIEMLENLLPFCLGCNKIFGADDRWYLIEECTNDFSAGQTSELMCPDCLTNVQEQEKS